MAVKKRAVKANQRAQPRTSVTFPHDLYQTIEEMAKVRRAYPLMDSAFARKSG